MNTLTSTLRYTKFRFRPSTGTQKCLHHRTMGTKAPAILVHYLFLQAHNAPSIDTQDRRHSTQCTFHGHAVTLTQEHNLPRNMHPVHMPQARNAPSTGTHYTFYRQTMYPPQADAVPLTGTQCTRHRFPV